MRLETKNTLHDFVQEVSRHTWHSASENRLHLDIDDSTSSYHKKTWGKGERAVG